jgi:hypothetical protein
MVLRNVGILTQHHTTSQHRRWRQHGPLKRWQPATTLHGVTTQKMKTAWSSETSVSCPNTVRHKTEHGSSMVIRNVGILPQHYTSQNRRWRHHGPPKRRYRVTTPHGVTTQKMEAACSSETSASCHNTTWRHETEDLDMNRRAILKPHTRQKAILKNHRDI